MILKYLTSVSFQKKSIFLEKINSFFKFCISFAFFSNNLIQDGVDGDCDILLKYPGGRSASLSTSVLAYMDNKALVHGTKGYLKVKFQLCRFLAVSTFTCSKKHKFGVENVSYKLNFLPSKPR